MTIESVPQAKKNILGLIGMIAGIVGVISLGLYFIIFFFFLSKNNLLYILVLFDCGFLFGLIAVITGIIGRNQIRSLEGIFGGKVMVLAALILGGVVIVVNSLLAIFIANVFFLDI
jgi:hypothetical protein